MKNSVKVFAVVFALLVSVSANAANSVIHLKDGRVFKGSFSTLLNKGALFDNALVPVTHIESLTLYSSTGWDVATYAKHGLNIRFGLKDYNFKELTDIADDEGYSNNLRNALGKEETRKQSFIIGAVVLEELAEKKSVKNNFRLAAQSGILGVVLPVVGFGVTVLTGGTAPMIVASVGTLYFQIKAWSHINKVSNEYIEK